MPCRGGYLTDLLLRNLGQLLNVEALANFTKDKNIPDIRTGDILAMRVVSPSNK